MPRLIIDDYPPLDFNYLVSMGRTYPTLTIEEKKRFIDEVIRVHPVLNYEFSSTATFFRVRYISNQKITHIGDIIWPQSNTGTVTRFGNMCYLANSDLTALAEADNKGRNTVVISRFKMLEDARLRIFPAGETDRIIRSGTGYFTPHDKAEIIQDRINACTIENHYSALAYIMQDAFLFEQLTCDDRELSGHTIRGVFDKHKTKMDAIGYPSVKRRGGLNLGVVTDNFWDSWIFVGISKARVRPLPFGYYDLIFLEHVSGIDSDGTLHWEKHPNKNEKMWRPISPT